MNKRSATVSAGPVAAGGARPLTSRLARTLVPPHLVVLRLVFDTAGVLATEEEADAVLRVAAFRQNAANTFTKRAA